MTVPRDGYRKGLRKLYDWLEQHVGGASSVTWGSVTGKPSTFPPAIGNTAVTAMAGNTAIPTLPTKGTAAELQAGNSTETRLWDAKTIHDEIARQIAAIEE